MRVALYSRFSTDMQSDASITDQERACRAYIKRQGWAEVAAYSDAGISGGKAEAHRPGYASLLGAARKRAFDAIVVEDVSRLWRDLAEQSRVVAELQHLGVHIVGINDGIDTRREGFDLLLAIKGAMNAGFRKEIARRTHRGLEGRALAGATTGGKTYGYRTTYQVVQENGRPVTKAVGREVVPEETEVVREIFKRYADGESPRGIADELNRRGVPAPGAAWKRTTRRRDSKWLSTAIYGHPEKQTGILNNTLYIGEAVWNRAQFVENPSTKRRERRERPESEWVRQSVPELRIIDQALWDAVKERQAKVSMPQQQRGGRTGRGAKYLFSGLLRCAVCGSKYTIWGPDYYGCASRTNGGKHACGNSLRVKRKVVESRLLKGIQQDILGPDAIELFRKEIARHMAEAQRAKNPSSKDAAARALATVEKEIANLLRAIKAGVAVESIKVELERLEAERVRLASSPVEEDTDLDKIVALLPRAVDRYRRAVGDFAEAVRRGDIEAARAEVAALLGGEVRLVPEAGGLVAELQADYAGLVKLAPPRKLVKNQTDIWSGSGGWI